MWPEIKLHKAQRLNLQVLGEKEKKLLTFTFILVNERNNSSLHKSFFLVSSFRFSSEIKRHPINTSSISLACAIRFTHHMEAYTKLWSHPMIQRSSFVQPRPAFPCRWFLKQLSNPWACKSYFISLKREMIPNQSFLQKKKKWWWLLRAQTLKIKFQFVYHQPMVHWFGYMDCLSVCI